LLYSQNRTVDPCQNLAAGHTVLLACHTSFTFSENYLRLDKIKNPIFFGQSVWNNLSSWWTRCLKT